MTTQNPKPKILHLDKRADQLVALGAEGNEDDLLNDEQLAAWFGVGVQWPCQARMGGFGPPFQEHGPRRIRYRRGDVIAWLRSRPRYTSTAESPLRGKVWNSPHRPKEAPVRNTPKEPPAPIANKEPPAPITQTARFTRRAA